MTQIFGSVNGVTHPVDVSEVVTIAFTYPDFDAYSIIFILINRVRRDHRITISFLVVFLDNI